MFQMVKTIFHRENSIKGASYILIVTLALSNVLGVLRDHFLAAKIPTDRLDVYFAAFRLPDLVFNILILGSIAAAFVPVYSNYLKEKGQKEATRLAQAVMTAGVIAVIISLILLFFLMPVLMKLLVPSFSVAKRYDTVQLARLLLLSPLFFTISYFLGGILNSHKRFFAYSIAPLIYNLSIIVSVLVFGNRLGVVAPAIGVIVGAFLHLLVQLPTALRLGFVPKPVFDFKNPGMIKIARLMVPRAIGLGANQVLLVGYTIIASAFPGAIAIYNFADNIQTVPSVIFGNSFALAVFPTLAALSVKNVGERKQFEGLFIKSVRAVLFFMIPSAAILILLRAQIVRLILGYGFFSWSDTHAATATLGFFALSIIAQGLIPLFARGFYAMHNTKTPMISSIIAIAVSIVTGYIFSRSGNTAINGVPGLALGFSLGSWLNLVILWVILQKKINFHLFDLSVFVLQAIVLTLLTGFVVQISKGMIANNFDIDRVRFLSLQTAVALVAGAIVYLGGAYLLRIKEIRS